MLKAHQACIDLEKNVLRIQGREVQFLPEHELPAKARHLNNGEETRDASTSSSSPPDNRNAAPFPGGGNTLGSAPQRSGDSHAQANASSRHSEDKIRVLMDLGASREVAIRSLDAANGNMDVAASLLF